MTTKTLIEVEHPEGTTVTENLVSIRCKDSDDYVQRTAFRIIDPSQDAMCTRSHPHELMSPWCGQQTKIARLENELANIKYGNDPAQAVPDVAALNAALSTAFSDDPANAVRAHAAVLPLFIAAPSPAAVGDDLNLTDQDIFNFAALHNCEAGPDEKLLSFARAVEFTAQTKTARAAFDKWGRPAPTPAVVPDWVTELKQELLMSKMTHNFTFTRDEVVDLLSLTSPAPDEYEEVDETAWLVEAQGPVYLGEQDDGILGWTGNHLQAIRFARKEDADRYVRLDGLNGATAVEHMWCAMREKGEGHDK